MRMADREVNELFYSLSGSEFKQRTTGSKCIVISSFAFSLEIYFKTILFCADEQARGGHNLENLWNELPDGIQTWLTTNFDNNYKSTGKDWSVMLLFSPNLRGTSKKATFTTPDTTAFGMIKGHRNAFSVGRYGYEEPESQKIKPILYNINGLQILSWLTRSLAYHVSKELEAAKEAQKGEIGHHTASITLPTGQIKRFPPKESK
jgi:hypothetical protein